MKKFSVKMLKWADAKKTLTGNNLNGIYFHDMVNALVNKKTTELQAHAGTD